MGLPWPRSEDRSVPGDVPERAETVAEGSCTSSAWPSLAEGEARPEPIARADAGLHAVRA